MEAMKGVDYTGGDGRCAVALEQIEIQIVQISHQAMWVEVLKT